MEHLSEELKSFNYGSGYPGKVFGLHSQSNKLIAKLFPLSLGDPKTKEFLRLSLDKIFGFPSFIRFGWSTAYSILNKDAIQCNFEEEEDEEEDENTPSVTNFFKKQTPQLKYSKFFAKHNMKRVDGFN